MCHGYTTLKQVLHKLQGNALSLVWQDRSRPRDMLQDMMRTLKAA